MPKINIKDRKAKNKETLNQCKQQLAIYCGIGGKYSTLELVVVTCAKLGITARGDIHPNQQIKYLCRKVRDLEKPKVNKCKTKKDFYSSRAWKILRYQAFEKYGNRCQCCGARPDDDIVLHVDHVKPRSTNPELALDLNNLQILCADCNIGKINQWDTNWRA